MTGWLKKGLSGAAVILVWIAVWQLASLFSRSSLAATPPLEVLREFASGFTGPFWQPIYASFRRILIGFGCALAIGSTLGAFLAFNGIARRLFGPLVLGVQSLPSICWLPVSILWFGLNEKAILFVVLMGSMGSITIAMRDGLLGIPPIYSRVAGTFGANAFQRLFLVMIPASLPGFISGLKQGWSFAWRSLMAGELLYHSMSLGSLLSDARDLADYPRMYAVMLLIILVSVAVDRLVFAPIQKSIHARWGLESKAG